MVLPRWNSDYLFVGFGVLHNRLDLEFCRIGGKVWTRVDIDSSDYSDVIYHRGSSTSLLSMEAYCKSIVQNIMRWEKGFEGMGEEEKNRGGKLR